jgi:homoserine dehydrogenase
VKKIKVGLIGLGTVGGGVVEIMRNHADDFKCRAGVDIELVRFADRNVDRFAGLGLDPDRCTIDAFEVISDPEIDIVIELIGGTGIALDVCKKALEAGKQVVTANKAIMATSGHELLMLAQERGLNVRFEASVGGGIPIIGPLKHSLVANEISQVMGIVNGTTNYILSAMAIEGIGYEEALVQAQQLGYAEADPSADVDGGDAAAKIAILASIAFNSTITMDEVFTEGIRSIDAADIKYAEEYGYAIKLLALAIRTPDGVDIRVHPTMIPKTHQLAHVNGVDNAISVVGDAVGETMFFGPGAGAGAAASAVMGDVIEVARDINEGRITQQCSCVDDLAVRSIDMLRTRYYVRMVVEDKPGVLAATASVFAKHRVSIESLIQQGNPDEGEAEIAYVTHEAYESDIQAALEEIRSFDTVREVASLIRVENL